MSDDLGFAAPASRRNLTTLRTALEAVRTGAVVTATFRQAEHGRFNVRGRVRRDLTDTVFKVGWWDLTTGKDTEPVGELQSLTVASEDDDDVASESAAAEDGELRNVVSTLEPGDIVTADFVFEGCGAFTISGGIRRDASGAKWVLAGHHLAYRDSPAARVRRLAIERRATMPDAADSRFDLIGG